ncbi:uncharacterized protein LOC115061869 isoform X2 [Echeneis naucrates]|uniref:uncharacterized protein LOC115061869 isoform X2 n=1 Tax=Echeneis naucrates TaxID=173247 RepID=UPI00111437DE|nr:uncharacterized protein LOC115061869 isoform X2 [Echeneis naucrates]XP_029386272.1 uncharacterized protein LOC115061869 isoform X2 [Echeneis naucrates]
MVSLPVDLLVLLIASNLVAPPVLGSLPVPVNVSIHSANFHHVLYWEAAPGTPPGTEYRILRRVQGRKKKYTLKSTTTSYKLKLNNLRMHYLSVQASYNNTLSPESHNIKFTPYKDTKIGPPNLSLADCGSCIQVNMSLPEADIDIHKFYDVRFSILWRKNGKQVMSSETQSKNFTLDNLQEGVEYCIQVHTKIRVNSNTEPSAWKCIFTKTFEHKGSFVIGAVAAFLIVVIGILMTSMFCLHYTGFLCKLKATLPSVVIMTLNQGYIQTPEGIIPDLVSVTFKKDKQEKHNKTTMSHSVTRDEGEYDWINVYMDRNIHVSSEKKMCCLSAGMRRNSKPVTSWDCESLTERLPAKGEVPDTEIESTVPHGGVDENETKAKVSAMSEERQIGFQQNAICEVMEEEEEMVMMKDTDEDPFENSGNVNLFSVILSTVDASEEEEQCICDSQPDQMKLDDLDLLQATLSHTDTRCSDHTTLRVAQPTNEESTRTGYEGRCGGYITTHETHKHEDRLL